MARLANTEVSFFRQVPIANGVTPIFRNYGEQLAAFNSKRVLVSTKTLYINMSQGYFDFNTNGGELDNLIQFCNYIGFFNNYFENKHFFCKISGLSKLSTNTTRVSFTVDAFQTFMFDFSMKSSLIKRQHLSEPQWQRALANPFRNDIQELTTDEGMGFTSADEVSYWDGRFTPEDGISQNGFKGVLGTHGGTTDRSVDGGPLGGQVVLGVDYGGDNRSSGSISPALAVSAKLVDSNTGSAKAYWYNMLSVVNIGSNFSKGFFFLQYTSEYWDGVMLKPNTYGTPTKEHIGANDYVLEIQKASSLTTITSLRNIYILPSWVVMGAKASPKDMQFPLRGIGAYSDYNDIPGYGTITDPKLRRAPFRFIRVTSPGGDDIELPLEKFSDPLNPYFTMQSDFTADPVMYMIPRNYDGANTAWTNAVSFGNYPTMPHFTNAYQSYITEQNRQRILADTASAKAARDRTQKPFKDSALGKVLGAIPVVGDAVNNTLSTLQKGFDFTGRAGSAAAGFMMDGPEGAIKGATQDAFEDAALAQAYAQMGGTGNGKQMDATFGDSYEGVYAHQRSAFVGLGEYTNGSLYNLGMMKGYDAFEFRHVTYKPEIIKGVDKILTVYGYRCDYYSTPRVYDYIRNINETPRFVSVDGMVFTYCQTENAGVYGLQDWANTAIEAVFNAGARFTRGFQ